MIVNLLITGLLVVVMAGVFWRRLPWGIYALLAVLPLERIGAWALNPATGHPVVRLSQLVGAALIVAFGLALLQRKTTLKRPPLPFWLLGAFGVSAGLSALFVGQRALISGWLALMFVITLTYVIYCLADQLNWRTVAWVVFASAGVVASFGLYQFIADSLGVSATYTGLREAYNHRVFGFPRVQSTALEPLYFANYLLIPLSLGLGSLAFRQPLKRWQSAVLGAAILAFVLTMSRGAFIGLAGAVVLGVAWLALSHELGRQLARWWKPVAGAMAALVVGLALVGLASSISTGSFSSGPRQFIDFATTSLTATQSFTERTQMREAALAIFRAHPVWGVGIEGITPYLAGYDRQRTQNDVVALNNQFYELLAEAGVVGAGLFYSFLVSLLIGAVVVMERANAASKARLFGLAVAIIAMTIQAQSFSGFLLTHFWVSYGLLAAITASGQTTRRQSQ